MVKENQGKVWGEERGKWNRELSGRLWKEGGKSQKVGRGKAHWESRGRCGRGGGMAEESDEERGVDRAEVK